MNNIEYRINDLSDLDSVIELSKKIFHPTPQEIQESHTKSDWLIKFNDTGLLVTAWVDNILVGFAFCYIKEKDSLHVWQVGVLEKYRGFKIWSTIFKKIEEYVRSKGYSRITLNTKQSKFPVMYKYVSEHGFSCYKTEIKDGIEKSFFEKNIENPH